MHLYLGIFLLPLVIQHYTSSFSITTRYLLQPSTLAALTTATMGAYSITYPQILGTSAAPQYGQ